MVIKCFKLLLATLAFPYQSGSWSVNILLPIQLLGNAPGKEVDDGLSTWATATHLET